MIDLNNLVSNPRKFTADESYNLNGPLIVTKLSNILQNMKNNKTPGLDVFLLSFTKCLGKSYSIFILKALNESYKKKEFTSKPPPNSD